MRRNGCEGEWHMANGWASLSDENTTPLAGRSNVAPRGAPAQAVADSDLIPVHSTPKASVGAWLQAEFTSMPDIHSPSLTGGHFAATRHHMNLTTLKLKHIVSKQPCPWARGQPWPGTAPKWPSVPSAHGRCLCMRPGTSHKHCFVRSFLRKLCCIQLG